MILMMIWIVNDFLLMISNTTILWGMSMYTLNTPQTHNNKD